MYAFRYLAYFSIFVAFLSFSSFYYYYSYDEPKSLLLVSFARHGARTPTRFWKQFKKNFPQKKLGDLTLKGYQQMNLLGQLMRKKTIKSQRPLLLKIEDEFVLVSSSKQRSKDSALAFSSGFTPNSTFLLIDKNTNKQDTATHLPPHIDAHPSPIFPYIIELESPDTMFHPRKCYYDNENIEKRIAEFHFKLLSTEEERKLVTVYLQESLPLALEELELSNGLIKEGKIKSVFDSIYSVNFEHPGAIKVPDHIFKIMKRVTLNEMFMKVIKNEYHAKLAVSHFFKVLLDLLEQKEGSGKSTADIFGVLFEMSENIKYVAFNGHDYNMIAYLRVLLGDRKLQKFLDGLEEGLMDKLFVSYAALLEFELVNETDGKYVRVRFNGQELFTEFDFGEKVVNYEKGKGSKFDDFRLFLRRNILEEVFECKGMKKN